MQLHKIIEDVVRRLHSLGEAVAGTDTERKVVESVKAYFDGLKCGSSARFVRVPVAVWIDHEAYVEASGEVFRGLSLPQTLGGEVEARLYTLGCDPLEAWCWNDERVRGNIVVVEAPRDVDEAATAYLFAVEAGAEAVVFYDPWPGRLRRVVVTGRWDFCNRCSAPAPIPAIYLSREDGLRLAKLTGVRARLVSRVSLQDGTGYIVELLLSPKRVGGGEWEVIVSAHHDHWLDGANDDLAGVATLVAVGELLCRSSEDFGPGIIRLVSFTAEEFGSPYLSAWYWAYGSAYYVSELENTGLLDKIVAVLNLDVIGYGKPRVYLTLELEELVRWAASRVGLDIEVVIGDNVYTDSYSFSSRGIPVASMINLEDYIEYYHTNLDTPDKLDYYLLAKVAEMVSEAVRKLANKGIEALDFVGATYKMYDYADRIGAPLPLKRSLYRLLREVVKAAGAKLHPRLAKAFRRLNSLVYAPCFNGDYRFATGSFEVSRLFPWLAIVEDRKRLQDALEALEKGDCNEALKIIEEIGWSRPLPGREELLASLLPSATGVRLVELLRACRTKEAAKILKVALERAKHVIRLTAIEASRAIDSVYYELVAARVGKRF